MAIQSATQSQSFSSIILAVKARLVAGAAGARTDNVQIICAPDDKLHEFLNLPGYRIRVHPADPDPMCGAGRNGYLTQRRFDVYVVTTNVQDPGGQDQKAVVAHLDREDSVLDTLILSPPGKVWVSAVGDLLKHIPGGDQITRLLKTNPAVIVSAIPFAITRVPPLTVDRE